MIDRTRCMALRDGEPLGGPRCQAPATHSSPQGRRCARHAEELRQALRDPHALINVITGDGKACTEEQIARLVMELSS